MTNSATIEIANIENVKNTVATAVAMDMQAVDALIRDKLYSEVALVRQVSEYIVSSGGKRLRPMLVLLSAGALGYQGTHHHMLAAVVEFIHTATLLHDDVVDESAQRRGRKTANALFGNAASVLVGDFLYSRAFQMMVTTNNMRVMQILAEATNIIAEGEVLQLMNIGDASLDEQAYLTVIRYKTAKLFEAAARLGVVLVQDEAQKIANTVDENAMAAYGMHLGTAFQIVDDVLDYSGTAGEIGKNLGDDLAEGKCTLPLIYAMQLATPAKADIVRQAISHAQAEQFATVLDIVTESGALAAAMASAHSEAAAALNAIQHLPDNQYTHALRALTRVAVERKA